MKEIKISHIFKSFGEKEVLTDFSASLKEGTSAALMAPSGSGKTTLLNILTGIEKADSGSITGLEGIKISMVFQEDRLCENMTPSSNIRLANPEISKKEADSALISVGLEDALNQKVKELSGGMKRRVAILRALMADYDLLLLDEPFRGLDEDTKEKVIKDTLKRSCGKTLLLVTHDKEEIDMMGIKNILSL